ncbi:NAD-dependent epimerase/dehydratase family protein [Allorhizocola rhizosphaerae]|uniref:NAD-dependent epimerase/dehydratase family protein n=1 Tax=Allorhizocola rhizosphaerae TaxID=1872709 RepID=UPI000E3BCA54|nr:NAD-dependent epimerase/dehydratase family protein [Allorhizocola rhizosphaerae]
MRILVLGGTSFVGRAIVDDAVGRGHEVTLFNRGRNKDVFPHLDQRVGDRASGDYASLQNGRWDAVVDVSAYIPRHVRQAADAVGDGLARYLFISTGSVYDHTGAQGFPAEDCPRLAPERGTEEVTGATYGPLKVACEDDVTARYGDRATIVRPGIVAGPHDPTDRFTYWVRHAARGGRVVLRGRPTQPTQVIDSTDLARLVTLLLEQDRGGEFNGTGEPVTLAELIRACGADEIEVAEPGEKPQPLVLSDPAYDIMFQFSSAKARAVGMPVTPYEQTAATTAAWDRERGEPLLKTE